MQYDTAGLLNMGAGGGFITFTGSGPTESSGLEPFSYQIIYRLGIVQTIASGCCDFIAQCIMVPWRISIKELSVYSHKFTRSTVIGLCGIKISGSHQQILGQLPESSSDCSRLQQTTVVPVVPVVPVEKVYVLCSVTVVYYSLLIVFMYPMKLVEEIMYRSL